MVVKHQRYLESCNESRGRRLPIEFEKFIVVLTEMLSLRCQKIPTILLLLLDVEDLRRDY